MLQVAKLYSSVPLGYDGFCITLKSTAGRDTTLLASAVISANTGSEMEQAAKYLQACQYYKVFDFPASLAPPPITGVSICISRCS